MESEHMHFSMETLVVAVLFGWAWVACMIGVVLGWQIVKALCSWDQDELDRSPFMTQELKKSLGRE